MLFRRTVEQFLPLAGRGNLYVVALKTHEVMILSEFPSLSPSRLILEPERRNTAPCVGLSTVCFSFSVFPRELPFLLSTSFRMGDVFEKRCVLR